jgi:predicted transcriptional regulator
VEPKTRHLIFTSIKLQKKLIICLFFFLLTTTAEATEYIVSPATSDELGASINGEEVVLLEDTIEPYWHFLLWLAVMQVLSVMDVLLLPMKIIFAILGFRITGHANVPENNKRSIIYAYIKDRPGAYLGEIVEKIGLNRGAVRHHISTLEAQNKIESYKDGGKIRYFQNNLTYDEDAKRVISALQNITNQKIISEIQNGSCNTNITLAREIGVSRATISWYIKNLKEMGLIKETKKGRSITYRIDPSYKNLIEKYG